MVITESAKQMLTRIMKEQNADGIRFYFAGQGCCGPQLGIALDAPEADDEIKVINGIQVAFDKRILNMTTDVTLDQQGGQLTLLGGGDNGCC
ncbi:adhesin [Bacillus paralicheniformis]|jgi:Fe-S cluster assembly iron-binding protein IscA|uniref:adhesin n=1 Tax=Bacillus TaxID=1386 RepID=UPI0005CE2DA0|nr:MULTISPECIES: adhesin [Bacillus]MDN5386681.1 adhesin [Bacillus sp. LB7]QII25353.1 adhesin [Bacillus altitudinis]QII49914.1 adhesin [Bacillus paralicheniformis]